eukprot:s723_g22.t1
MILPSFLRSLYSTQKSFQAFCAMSSGRPSGIDRRYREVHPHRLLCPSVCGGLWPEALEAEKCFLAVDKWGSKGNTTSG